MSQRLIINVSAILLATALTGACAVGPDFVPPAPPEAGAYDSKGLPEKTSSADTAGGEQQKFTLNKDIPADWWTLFQSESLNALVKKALTANPDLQAANAALRVAQENLYAYDGNFLPSVDGQAGVTRQKSSEASTSRASSAFTLYNASVAVSYSPDVFGGTRRGSESLAALADVKKFEVDAAYISLTTNVVTTAVQEASLRAQISATREILNAEEKQLDLLQRQFELGGASKVDVLAQTAKLAQTNATLPPLEKSLAQTRNQLSALTGQLPSEDLGVKFNLSNLKLPEELPITLPSRLVEQRPDIQAASAQLHAASAAIGVATANMLPNFTLSANYGASALEFTDLFSPTSAAWSLGASILQPIFHGGELKHKLNASEAAFDVAYAQYKSTVLSAVQNVADSLRALQYDADALKSQLEAEQSAKDSLDLSKNQFSEGAISYISLLTAEQAYQQTKIALEQARARRYSDTVALFQSLGGGWWNRESIEVKSSAASSQTATNDGSK